MSDEGKQATRKGTDEEIGEALQVHRNTVGRVRQRFLEKGEKPALERRPSKIPPTPSKIDRATEAQLIAWCGSEPPTGRAKWSIKLLTSELKRRQIITEISGETVRRTPKKTNYVRGKRKDLVFPNEI
jgi:transposase